MHRLWGVACGDDWPLTMHEISCSSLCWHVMLMRFVRGGLGHRQVSCSSYRRCWDLQAAMWQPRTR